MYSDLPPHLQTLNAIPSSSSPPSTALNAEQEEAFWSFLNTDELFANIGVAPQAFEAKLANEQQQQQQQQRKESPASTPATAKASPSTTASGDKPTTLESFLANFADEPPIIPNANANANNYLLSLASQYSAAASTSTSTPAADSTVPETPSTPAFNAAGERITGAKRLKQMGAPPAEIEEDKRRRNTEASARFRAKKKEREQALERRAKELEAQVANLTSEKASLEKENSLLKFILVNGGQQNNNAAASSTTPLKTPEALQAALASLGKRKQRDE